MELFSSLRLVAAWQQFREDRSHIFQTLKGDSTNCIDVRLECKPQTDFDRSPTRSAVIRLTVSHALVYLAPNLWSVKTFTLCIVDSSLGNLFNWTVLRARLSVI